MRIAVYPGTFDPVTNGHLDIMKRGLKIFDKLIIAVALNPKKNPLFSRQERVNFIKKATEGWENIIVDSFESLLIDYAKKHNAIAIIKGLRAVSDFEFELQMGLMNRTLNSNIETIFMLPSEEYFFLNSRIIKEVASLHGDISKLVPPVVEQELKEKFGKCK
ncbi:MAG: pantetheine-phosphate adenylyltransferase [Nitrospinae bacterium]|nr:pantetheine-phosphate adenylyltransferase [Nitrospinota bacterium]